MEGISVEEIPFLPYHPILVQVHTPIISQPTYTEFSFI